MHTFAHAGDGLVGAGAFILDSLRFQVNNGQIDEVSSTLQGVFTCPEQLYICLTQRDGHTLVAGVERVPGSAYAPLLVIPDDERDRLLHMAGLRVGDSQPPSSRPLPLLLSLHEGRVAAIQQKAVGDINLVAITEDTGLMHVWGHVRLQQAAIASASSKASGPRPAKGLRWARLAKIQLADSIPSLKEGHSTVIDLQWEGASLLVVTASQNSGHRLWVLPFAVGVSMHGGKPSVDIALGDAGQVLADGGAPLTVLPGAPRGLLAGPAGVWAVCTDLIALWSRPSGSGSGTASPAHCVSARFADLLAPRGPEASAAAAPLCGCVHPDTGELLLLTNDGALAAASASSPSGGLVCQPVSSLQRLGDTIRAASSSGGAVRVQLQAHRQLALVLLSTAAAPGGGGEDSSGSGDEQQLCLLYDIASGTLLQVCDLGASPQGQAFSLWCAGTDGPVSVGLVSPVALLTLLEPPLHVYAQAVADRIVAAAAAGAGGEGALAAAALCSFLCRAYAPGSSPSADSSALPLTHWGVRYAIDWAFGRLAAASSSSAPAEARVPGDALAPAVAASSALAPSFPALLRLADGAWQQVAEASPSLALAFAASGLGGESPLREAGAGALRASSSAVRLLVRLLRVLGVKTWAIQQALQGRPVAADASDLTTAPDGANAPALLSALASPDEVLAPVLQRAARALGGGGGALGDSTPSKAVAAQGGQKATQKRDQRERAAQQVVSLRARHEQGELEREAAAETESSLRGSDAADAGHHQEDAGSGGQDGGASGGGADLDWVMQRLAGIGGPSSASGSGATAGAGGSDSGAGGAGPSNGSPTDGRRDRRAALGAGGDSRARDHGASAAAASSGQTDGDASGLLPSSSSLLEEPLSPELLRYLTPHNVALAPRLLECLRLHALVCSLLGASPGDLLQQRSSIRAAHAFVQSASASPSSARSGSSGRSQHTLRLMQLTAPAPPPTDLATGLHSMREAEAASGRPDDAAVSVTGEGDASPAGITLPDVYWHGVAACTERTRHALLHHLGVATTAQAAAAAAGAAQPPLHSSLLQPEAVIALPLGILPAGMTATDDAADHAHPPAVPEAVAPAPEPVLELVTRLLYRGKPADRRRIAGFARRVETSLPPVLRPRAPASLTSLLRITDGDAGGDAETRRLSKGGRPAALRALLALPPYALAAPAAAAAADAGGGPVPAGEGDDDGVPGSILPHVQLLLQLHRGADALRLLLRAGCWGAALRMLEESELQDGFTAGRDPHPLKDVKLSPSTVHRDAPATLGDLATQGGLTVAGLLAVLADLPAPSAPVAPDAAPSKAGRAVATRAAAAGRGQAEPAAPARPVPTGSALRWSREATTRVAYFHALFEHALREGAPHRLVALWRRAPHAYILPSVLATMRAALVGDARDSGARGIPCWAVLPALAELSALHEADLQEQARFWRQQGGVRPSGVLREWGSAN